MYLPQGILAYQKDRGSLRTFRFVALELVPLVGRGGEVKTVVRHAHKRGSCYVLTVQPEI